MDAEPDLAVAATAIEGLIAVEDDLMTQSRIDMSHAVDATAVLALTDRINAAGLRRGALIDCWEIVEGRRWQPPGEDEGHLDASTCPYC